MTQDRALVLAAVTFVVSAIVVVAIFLALDVRMLFLPGPLAAVGAASYGAYLAARGSQTT